MNASRNLIRAMIGKTRSPEASKKPAPFEVEQVDLQRSAHHLHGELDQRNLPSVVHPDDDGAGRIAARSDLLDEPVPHRLQRLVRHALGKAALREIETVLERRRVAEFPEPVREGLGLFSEAL